jgi:glutamyl-tRNA reductase
MKITLTGINHQIAPVAIREKVAISTDRLPDALSTLRAFTSKGLVLSTCNRTEVYTVDSDESQSGKAGLNFLKTRLNIPDDTLPQYMYILENIAAVEHLFRVASGLESMIIGEYEVLGQVGQALKSAERAGMTNLPLRHIFQDALRTGRRVREETEISRNALSVSSVAVDMAVEITGNLDGNKMLVIGVGEAGRLVAKVAGRRGISRLVVVGRTKERASSLAAQIGGIPITSSDLEEELCSANIVVTCAGAPHRILSVGQVKRAIEKRPEIPMVIIDIAVPRNVEPSVSQIKNVFLYNIDDLTRLCDSNRNQREGEINRATVIVNGEVEKFSAWWQEYKVRPLIRAMTGRAEKIRLLQLDRTLKKLPHLTEEERYSLEMMTRAIVTKIIKDPIQYLKTNGHKDCEYEEIVKELFHLDLEDR